MFETERMSKIRVFGVRSKLPNVIKTLHELQLMDIVDHKKSEEFDIGAPLEDAEKISELLVKIRSLISGFERRHTEEHDYEKPEKPIGYEEHAAHEKQIINEIEKLVCGIEKKIKANNGKIKEFDDFIAKNNVCLQKLDVLNSLYLDIESYKPYKNLAVLVGYIKHNESIKKKLSEITAKFKLHISKNGKSRIVALFVEKKSVQKVLELLKKEYAFAEVDISAFAEWKGTPISHINMLNDKVQKAEMRKKELLEEIDDLMDKNKRKLFVYEKYLGVWAERAGAPLRFAETKNSFFVTGWVPDARLKMVVSELEKTTNSQVFVEEKEPEKNDSIPVKLKNAAVIKPFEFFMRLYTLPKYSEIDPSFFIFITFPLFFGFMLGDVGYGLATLILFWSLKKAIPAGKALLNSMMHCSFWSMLFGFVFGEYFGFERLGEGAAGIVEALKLPFNKIIFEGEIAYEFPRIINRMHGTVNVMGNEIHSVLLIGAIAGIIHINLSLLAGFVNAYKAHGLKHAVLEKLSWMVFEAGIALTALSAFGMVSLPIYIGWTALLLAVVMIYLGEGVQGLVELPAIFSNILSYIRLGAVGLASVGLAVVVNETLGLPFINKGGIFIFIGLLIMVLGHSINIALGILGSFLHSIRLHYVEFFNRFYKGGGREYRPFGAER